MSEILQLNLGNPGAQISFNFMQQLFHEHQFLVDGIRTSNNLVNQDNLSCMFAEKSPNKYVPRSIFIDFDSEVITNIQKNIPCLTKENIVCGLEDIGSNFFRAKYSVGKEILEEVLDKIRIHTEQCDHFRSLLINHSISGGTGGGFFSLLLEKVREEYQKINVVSACLFPSNQFSDSIVAPYNSVLTIPYLCDYTDLCIIFQNESCYKRLQDFAQIESPSYTNINSLIGNCIINITASMRFPGTGLKNFDEIIPNLCPYPRIHYVCSGLGPYSINPNNDFEKFNSTNIINNLFSKNYQLAEYNPSFGHLISCTIIGRGNVEDFDIKKGLDILIKKKINPLKFVCFAPRNFGLAISKERGSVTFGENIFHKYNTSMTQLSSNTTITTIFSTVSLNLKDYMQEELLFIGMLEKEEKRDYFQKLERMLKHSQKIMSTVRVAVVVANLMMKKKKKKENMSQSDSIYVKILLTNFQLNDQLKLKLTL